jgi:hypothetical protein
MTQLYFGLLHSTAGSGEKAVVTTNLKSSNPDADLDDSADHGSTKQIAANPERLGSGEVQILKVFIVNERAEECSLLISGETYTLTQIVQVNSDIVGMSSGFLIRTKAGVEIFGATTQTLGAPIEALLAGSVVTISMQVTMHLGAGDYFLLAANASPDGRQYDCLINALHFKVHSTPQIFTTSLVNLRPQLSVTYRDKDGGVYH